ncbi:hypothetical protein ACFLUO_04705 [Chloroflexota bacterium]
MKMKAKLIINKLLVTSLLFLLIFIPIITVGCHEEVAQPPATSTHSELSTTLVPNMNLDMYVYAKQDNPTIVPKEFIGATSDVVAESLSLWGIPTEDTIILGGGLTFTSGTDATKTHSQIPSQTEFWTKLSDRTIYFVQGSGVIAENLKAAISKNDFKYYDDQEALPEIALLPNSEATTLAVVGIVKPSEVLMKMIADNISPEYSDMINTLLTWARLQVIAVGLYAPQQIDVAEIAQKVERGSIWESDLGILALIKTGLPGFVTGPIVKNILKSSGYVETTINELTLYKGSLDAGSGNTVPILIRIEGNRIYATVSGQESYAWALITNGGG